MTNKIPFIHSVATTNVFQLLAANIPACIYFFVDRRNRWNVSLSTSMATEPRRRKLGWLMVKTEALPSRSWTKPAVLKRGVPHPKYKFSNKETTWVSPRRYKFPQVNGRRFRDAWLNQYAWLRFVRYVPARREGWKWLSFTTARPIFPRIHPTLEEWTQPCSRGIPSTPSVRGEIHVAHANNQGISRGHSPVSGCPASADDCKEPCPGPQ